MQARGYSQCATNRPRHVFTIKRESLTLEQRLLWVPDRTDQQNAARLSNKLRKMIGYDMTNQILQLASLIKSGESQVNSINSNTLKHLLAINHELLAIHHRYQ